MKTKRKDKWKNRNKPAQSSWPIKKMVRENHPVIGMVCGRCDSLKEGKSNKCPNRWKPHQISTKHPLASFLEVLPKNYEDYFCIKDREVYING